MDDEQIEITAQGYNALLQSVENKLEKAIEEIQHLKAQVDFYKRTTEAWEGNAESWKLLYEVSKMQLNNKI